MAQPDVYIPVIADVVAGWNEKLALNSNQLSLFVPFCDLYAVFSAEDSSSTPQDAGDRRMQNTAFTVNLKTWKPNEQRSVSLLPLFNLYQQQTTIDPKTGRLLRSRGIGGIESVEVETDNIDDEMWQIMMKISVPSFDEDVLTNKAIRRLTVPGSEFIIIYGWARDSSQGNRDFAPITNNTIDLTNPHKGYYRFLHGTLLACEWDYTAARVAEGNLRFRPLDHVAGTVATMDVHKKNIKRLLNNETELQSPQNCPADIKSQLPESVSVKHTRPVQTTSGKGKKTVQQQETGYFNLGWVIEAMRQSMDDGHWRHTIYDKWTDPHKTKVKTLGDNNSEPTPIVANSPAEVPIPIDDLDAEVFDLTTNETILFSIGKVLELANRQLFVNTGLIVQGESDGATISIRDAHQIAFNVANQTDVMAINVSSPNSLLESLKFGSRVPLDWTYGLNTFLHTDEGATEIYNMFQKDSELDSPQTATGVLLKKFKKASLGTHEALDANRLSNWKKQLNASDKKDKIVQEVLANDTVPIGLALRQFFKSVTLTIHGTAFVPPWTQIAINGMLPGIDGIYSVFRISDSLSPGNFSTTLEALLLHVF